AQWPNAKRRALYVGAAPGAAGLSGLVCDALRRIDRGSARQAADPRRETEADRERDVSEAFDAIVIGAGAAGLMCALTAGQRGRKVLLLEHLDKVGAKILISGGGRCNFTNLYCTPDRFISANPHFHKS